MSPDVEMTFMEHLEELRTRILHCLYAIVPALGLACFFAPDILLIITEHARGLDVPMKGVSPLSFGFSPVYGPFLTFNAMGSGETMLQSLAPTETIVTYMKIALVAAIFLIFPVIIYEVWRFIEPGLRQKEKKFLVPFVVFSWIFFIAGGVFAFLVVLPIGINFLVKFGQGITVNAWSLSNYVSFVLRMVLAFGVVFEMPIISALLSVLGILTPAFLRKYRAYAFLFNFVISGFLTPPDPGTMILMAIPLTILYEISIFVSAFFQRKPTDLVEKTS